MSDKSYMEALGELSSAAKSAQHAAQIVAAMTPPPVVGAEMVSSASPAAVVPAAPRPSMGRAIVGLAPGVVAGGVGAVMWGNHRVLGFLTGHALGSNAGAVLRGVGQERRDGMCRLGVEGAGVVGALMLKSKLHPIFGWMAGVASGLVATSFVKGSPAHKLRSKMFNK